MAQAIYLHSNGTFIEKPSIVYASDPSYFSSPFVMKVWYDVQNFQEEDWFLMLADAIIKGALPLEVIKLAKEKGLSQQKIDKILNTPR